jgi:hypothetical protein
MFRILMTCLVLFMAMPASAQIDAQDSAMLAEKSYAIMHHDIQWVGNPVPVLVKIQGTLYVQFYRFGVWPMNVVGEDGKLIKCASVVGALMGDTTINSGRVISMFVMTDHTTDNIIAMCKDALNPDATIDPDNIVKSQCDVVMSGFGNAGLMPVNNEPCPFGVGSSPHNRVVYFYDSYAMVKLALQYIAVATSTGEPETKLLLDVVTKAVAKKKALEK